MRILASQQCYPILLHFPQFEPNVDSPNRPFSLYDNPFATLDFVYYRIAYVKFDLEEDAQRVVSETKDGVIIKGCKLTLRFRRKKVVGKLFGRLQSKSHHILMCGL